MHSFFLYLAPFHRFQLASSALDCHVCVSGVAVICLGSSLLIHGQDTILREKAMVTMGLPTWISLLSQIAFTGCHSKPGTWGLIYSFGFMVLPFENSIFHFDIYKVNVQLALPKLLFLIVPLSNSISLLGKQLYNMQIIIISFLPILRSYFFVLDIEIIKTSEHCLIDMTSKIISVFLLILIKMTLIFHCWIWCSFIFWYKYYNHIFRPTL